MNNYISGISQTVIDNFIPTWLYIKQHEVTGLLYFGKTTQTDPIKYRGSGKYWSSHYRKHGLYKIKTIWCELFTDMQQLVEFATYFSECENIVESDKWANLIPENGLNGISINHIVSDETRNKMRKPKSESHKKNMRKPLSPEHTEKLRKPKSESHKKNMSIARTGEIRTTTHREKISKTLSNHMYRFISPTGEIYGHFSITIFCSEHNLCKSVFYRMVNKGIILPPIRKSTIKRDASIGWEILATPNK